MAEELKLHSTWSSRFGLRIAWALHIKGVEYDAIFEDLSQKSPELLQYNPIHKKVPVLVHKGKPICESLVILEYIDETWKEAPLLPQDPYEKAMARFWAKFGDEKLLDLVFGWLAYLLDVFEEAIDLKLFDAGKFPHLSAWMKNFYDAPVIKEHCPPRDKLVTKYQTANAPK